MYGELPLPFQLNRKWRHLLYIHRTHVLTKCCDNSLSWLRINRESGILFWTELSKSKLRPLKCRNGLLLMNKALDQINLYESEASEFGKTIRYHELKTISFAKNEYSYITYICSLHNWFMKQNPFHCNEFERKQLSTVETETTSLHEKLYVSFPLNSKWNLKQRKLERAWTPIQDTIECMGVTWHFILKVFSIKRNLPRTNPSVPGVLLCAWKDVNNGLDCRVHFNFQWYLAFVISLSISCGSVLNKPYSWKWFSLG